MPYEDETRYDLRPGMVECEVCGENANNGTLVNDEPWCEHCCNVAEGCLLFIKQFEARGYDVERILDIVATYSRSEGEHHNG